MRRLKGIYTQFLILFSLTCCSPVCGVIQSVASEPKLICAADRIVECGMAWDFDTPIVIGAPEKEPLIVVTGTITNFQCGGTFSATRSWSYTDLFGKISTCSQTISILDKQPPALTCPTNIVVRTRLLEPLPVDFVVLAQDACDSEPVILYDFPPGSSFPVGDTLVTATAVDACGNLTSCSFMITVVYESECNIAIPSSNIVVECTVPNGAVVNYPLPVITNVCTSTIVQGITWTCSPPPGLFPPGTTQVTCVSSALQSGEIFTNIFTVTVTGGCPSSCISVTCPTNMVVQCDRPEGATVHFSLTASNICGIDPVTITSIPPSGSLFPIGVTEVVSIASSSLGTNECRFTVTVIGDCTNAKLVCDPDRTFEFGETWEFDPPTVSGNPGASSNIVIVSTVTNQLCGSSFSATRTWSFSDAFGKTSTCSQTVSVVDTTPPTIYYPSNFVFRTSVEQPARVDYIVFAEDQGDLAPKVECVPPSASDFPVGATTVRVTATDACGNTSTTNFTVTVVVQPQCYFVERPIDIVTQCASPDGAIVSSFPIPYAVNNCTGQLVDGLTWTFTPPPGVFPPGTSSVVCESSPLPSGEILQTSFTITVTGTCPSPCISFKCPDNLIVQCESLKGTIVNFPVTAANLCGAQPVSIICNPPSGSIFPPGLTEVVCVATTAEATNRCTFTVNVIGTCLPSIAIDNTSTNAFVLKWPASAKEFVLEETDNLNRPPLAALSREGSLAAKGAGNWRESLLPVFQDRSFNYASVSAGVLSGRYYRIRALPRNDAIFVRQEVPTRMITGDRYTARVVMYNSGTTTWMKDEMDDAFYALSSQYPTANLTWGTNLVRVPASNVLPREEATFEFSFNAPTVPGRYVFQWRMAQNNVEWFGQSSPYLEVEVVPPTGFRCVTPGLYLFGTPTAILGFDGKINVFTHTLQPGAGENAGVLHTFEINQGGPYGWRHLAQGLGIYLRNPSYPTWSASVAVTMNFTGLLEFLAWARFVPLSDRGRTASMYVHYYQRQDGSWSAPEFFGRRNLTMDPAPSLIMNADGRLEWFGVASGELVPFEGSHVSLVHKYQQLVPGGYWGFISEFERRLLDDRPYPPVLYPPVAMVDAHEDVHVFYLAADRSVRQFHRRRGQWLPSVNLGGTARHIPSVEMNADGRLVVAVRGENDGVWIKNQLPGGGWEADWTHLPDAGGGGTGYTPVFGKNRDGRLEIHLRSMDGTVHYITQKEPNGGWPERWQSLGGTSCVLDEDGTVRGGRIVGSLSLVRTRDNCLNLFAVDTGGRLITRKQISPGVWR